MVALALLVAVVAGVATALTVADDKPRDPTGWSTPSPNRPPNGGPIGPGPPPRGRNVAPPPFACVRPDVVGSPVQAGTPNPGEEFRPPPGWLWHADTAGFRVSVPATWLTSRDGTVTCFQDPATSRAFSVADGGAADPLELLRTARETAAAAGALPGYDEIRLAAGDGGAEWELRWQTPHGPWLHARQEVLGADRWTLGWITRDEDWAGAAADWERVRKSFRPPR
ncbi:hypothetical protein GUI43_06558 [Micromonospora noduli]|nr:hypothetical protein GUI43_06558 [Micromonospora noduli]